MSANVQQMVYTGAIPWHKQGVHLAAAFTAADALKQGGLDFSVEKRAITVEGTQAPSDRFMATVRTDNMQVLGLVGSRYEVLQNREAFEFFDVLCGEGKAIYETAGVLGMGERVWIMAKTSLVLPQVAGDEVTPYMLLSNSHDGTAPVQVLFTPIRVVCQNTLTAALRSTSRVAVIRHSGDVKGKVKAAADVFNQGAAYFGQMQKAFELMGSVHLTDSELDAYLASVLGNPEATKSKRIANIRASLIREVSKLARNGRGNDRPQVRGTLWTAYNGAIEYVDYVRQVRGESDPTQSILFGGGQKLKQKAFDNALALLG